METHNKKRRKNGFYEAVKKRLGANVNVSSSHISMVKSGRRKNDAVLMAIIEVDHQWQRL